MFSCQLCMNNLTPPPHQPAEVTPKTFPLKLHRPEPQKQVCLHGQVNRPLYVNQAEEIKGEGRKWQLKRVRDQAQASFCSSGGGTALPSIWFHKAQGMRCVYFPQLAHFSSSRGTAC